MQPFLISVAGFLVLLSIALAANPTPIDQAQFAQAAERDRREANPLNLAGSVCRYGVATTIFPVPMQGCQRAGALEQVGRGIRLAAGLLD